MRTWIKYGAAIMGLLIVSALIISFGMKKEESYRDIKVMSIKGTATVERASVGSLDAYEDMKLESGDRLSVDSSSSLILSMDDNKYAMLEPGSSLTLEADGTRENSRTIIHLESGAVMNYLSEKLSEKSSYEVTVPNSTMAVRGTVFRVAIVYDEDGDSYTTVQVFDGIVGCRLVFPDGTISEEEVQLAPGKEVLIHGDTEISEYVGDKGHDIDYTTLNRETLEFLLFCIDDGSDLCLTREEVEELLRRLDQTEEPEESAEVKKPAKTEKEPAVIETTEPVVPAVEETPSSSGGSSETSKDSPGNDDNQKSHHSSKKKPSSSDEETKTYTVTFQTASGDVFCTQTVEDGKTASKPKLQPSASGS